MASSITITRQMNDGLYNELLDACTHYGKTMGWSAAVTLNSMAKDSTLFKNWKKRRDTEAKRKAVDDE